MKVRHGKRCLNRLHYFGKRRTGVRDTGTKSRRKFQQLIDSGTLDIWAPIGFYNSQILKTEAIFGSLHDCKFIEEQT